MSSVISHYLSYAPDWNQLREDNPRDAADALAGLLRLLDRAEKQVFAMRGMAMMLIEERELWHEFVDPSVDRVYESFDRWLKDTCPNSWGYCRDALRAVKELKEIPFEDLLATPRCNIQTLLQTSTNVRKLPEVIKAAKTMSESEFAQKLTRDHDQHLEGRRTLRLSYSASDYAAVMEFLTWVGSQQPDPTDDPATALLAYAIDWGLERSE